MIRNSAGMFPKSVSNATADPSALMSVGSSPFQLQLGSHNHSLQPPPPAIIPIHQLDPQMRWIGDALNNISITLNHMSLTVADQVSQIAQQNQVLAKRVTALETRQLEPSIQAQDSVELTIAEMNERQRRSSNLILYDIKEDGIKEHDMKKAQEVVAVVNNHAEVLRVNRIGPTDSKRPRPRPLRAVLS